MKTRMVEEREGEDMGPVDWSHEMLQRARVSLDKLKALEANPEGFLVTDDGGSPRFGWKRALALRMYDGWPYWEPGPAVLAHGPLGVTWIWVSSITDIEPVAALAAKGET